VDGRASTTVTNFTRAFLTFAIPSAEDRASVVAGAGAVPEILARPDARLSAAVAARLWSLAAERGRDDAMGLHFAEAVDVSALGVVGYFAGASDSVRTALRRVVTHHRLLKDPSEVELLEAADSATVTERPPRTMVRWPRHLAEATVATYVTMIRSLTGAAAQAHAVSFQHARPPCIDEHVRVLGCVPCFDADANRITFSQEVLSLPLLTGDAALSRYLAIAVDEQMSALPRDDLLPGLERAILAALPDGPPSIRGVARALGVGPRTLQRRLYERGTSFHGTVDRVRQTAARKLLADARLSIAEVALLLGFSDASGLQRAHRRWTGRSVSFGRSLRDRNTPGF
jgi:AraC-like DNA-binding protein